jgi:hypothetical protein
MWRPQDGASTPFIELGSEEMADRGGGGGAVQFSAIGFKIIKGGEEEAGQRHLDGGLEGDCLALRFNFIQAREGGHRR